MSPLQKYDVKVMMCRKLPKFWLVGWLVDWLIDWLFIYYLFISHDTSLFIYLLYYIFHIKEKHAIVPACSVVYVCGDVLTEVNISISENSHLDIISRLGEM